MQAQKLWTLFDHYYVVAMAAIAPIIIYLNYSAHAYLAAKTFYYQEVANVIAAGFDPSVSTHIVTSGPWGYAWLLLLTNSYPILMIIQFSLAIFSIWYCIKILENNTLLSRTLISLLKITTVICIPWYTFHTIRQPNSIASSLAIIALVKLYDTLKHNRSLNSLLIAAIAFGLLLNFRSDYVFLPPGLAGTVIWHSMNLKIFKKMFIWICFTYACLIPWAFFTKKVCGHYLISSTNGGHVCLAGLGKLPNNKWGISNIDTDSCPIIHGFVDDVYGKNTPTWDYKGNLVLKQKFFELVRKNPAEYFKKCCYSLYLIATQGVYNGEFVDRSIKSSIRISSTTLFEKSHSFGNKIMFLIRSAAQHFARGLASHITLSAYLLLPAALFAALYTNNLFFLMLLCVITYQTLLGVLCDLATHYTSNIFFFLIISIFYVLYAAFSNIGIKQRTIKK